MKSLIVKPKFISSTNVYAYSLMGVCVYVQGNEYNVSNSPTCSICFRRSVRLHININSRIHQTGSALLGCVAMSQSRPAISVLTPKRRQRKKPGQCKHWYKHWCLITPLFESVTWQTVSLCLQFMSLNETFKRVPLK